jgi:elongator complex protein 1
MEYGPAFTFSIFRVSINSLLRIVKDGIVNYRLDIYHRSNYDWSLKYSYQTDKLLFAKFSDGVSLRLFTMTESGKFQAIDFKFDYQNSLANNNLAEDSGNLAVISGNNVKLTPLGLVNIPPPMALETIPLKTHQPYVLQWWKNYLFIFSMGHLDIIHTNKREYKNIFSSNLDIDTRLVKSVIFTTHENLGYFTLNVAKEFNELMDDLVIFTLEISQENNIITFKNNNFEKKTIAIEKCVGNLFNSVKSDNLYEEKFYTQVPEETIKNDERDLFSGLSVDDIREDQSEKYFYMINTTGKDNVFNKVSIPDFIITEVHVHPTTDVIKARSIIINNQEKIIYLTNKHKLYLGTKTLALDTTSFEFFKKFLIFTQTSNSPYNTLHIVDLSNNDVILNHNSTEALYTPNFNYKTFTLRTVERGSLIVTVNKVNLVLQMPRGNLETIYPRLLVLNLISELIKERRYSDAFELTRKHKINTNYLYDVDPEGFFSNIASFISQVNNVIYKLKHSRTILIYF